MRWSSQAITAGEEALPGLVRLSELVRTVRTPEFEGITFYEILAKSALNKVHSSSSMPFGWTINPMRGCTHACTYCFARPTHEYLEFDGGRDFDSQIVVKVNVADVLAKELGRPSWGRHPVALGTNTDPYQRAEGRYQLMPGIIAALAASGTPLSILTKGSLLRRDLPLLAEAAEHVPVDLGVSIAVYDDELQRSLEPGAPSAAARLATVTAAREAGFECSVFLMPILPFLTDTRAHLDAALSACREAGASTVMYSALHLKPGVKDWFFGWLAAEHPELVDRYRALYSGRSASAPIEYRRWLSERIRPLMRRHRLRRGEEDPATGSVRSSALGGAGSHQPLGTLRVLGGERRGLQRDGLLVEELGPERAAALPGVGQPTLF
ncbi:MULTISPECIES: Rv2578c family radical SAM protein [unclassified Rathayibacter]|uniref:Rv2578c family radical SAM protein n=1 Tax=unclassified Rathayibacter TaxID=2609250 RepID=UPI00188BF5AF|nr:MULTISPECIES: Rv2578c family radical SAM protein [unclassified Rathayibacter]MBF4462880.1 Rv2578c family radical SAM protein [Rathayibacter sp. VKM Ac-2879]MBF4504294.1 Rv2578c family radical SAM protein [Rathayibacter sp. VKM Ac-2878]